MPGRVTPPSTPGFYWARSDKDRTLFDLIVYNSSERERPWMVINVVLGKIEYPKVLPPAIVLGPPITYPRVA